MNSARDNHFINQIDLILEVHFENEIFGVKELASYLYISRSQLHRKFKAALGISASSYINQYRLKKAMVLLQQGNFKAFEAAYAVGFRNPSYFSTAFKKYYSFSPSNVPIKINDNTLNPIDSNIEQYDFINQEIAKKINNRKYLWLILIPVIILVLAISPYFISNKNFTELKPDLLAINNEKSIVVLPFRNYSNDPMMDYFCNGITDEIILNLNKIGGFNKVISRASSQKIKDLKLSLKEISSELNVNYILEGTLQKSDDKIKVIVQLIDVKTDCQVWEEIFTGTWSSKEIFKIQEKITFSVTNALNTVLTQEAIKEIQQQLTSSKKAYDSYLLAKYHSNSSDEESIENAKYLLHEAISLDSTFAEAYSLLGYIWMCSGFAEGFRKQEVAWNNGKYFLTKAKELNPKLINNEFHLLQGQFYYEWDFQRLEEFFHNDFDRYIYDYESSGLIDYALKTGRYNKALNVINKSIEVDPLDAVLYSFKARALFFMGNKKEAVETLKYQDPLNKYNWFYLREAAHNYYLMKEYDYSKKLMIIMKDQFQDQSPFILWLQLYYAYLDNKLIIVEALLNELIKSYENEDSGSPAWFIALYQLEIKKDIDAAFDWLEKSYKRKEVELTWLLQEPLLKPIKNDLRYNDLLQKIGFNQVQ
jgi:TolB-like protein/AraC-like DNA-binding protein